MRAQYGARGSLKRTRGERGSEGPARRFGDRVDDHAGDGNADHAAFLADARRRGVFRSDTAGEGTYAVKHRFIWPEELRVKFVNAVFDVGLRSMSAQSLTAATQGRAGAHDEIEGLLKRYRETRGVLRNAAQGGRNGAKGGQSGGGGGGRARMSSARAAEQAVDAAAMLCRMRDVERAQLASRCHAITQQQSVISLHSEELLRRFQKELQRTLHHSRELALPPYAQSNAPPPSFTPLQFHAPPPPHAPPPSYAPPPPYAPPRAARGSAVVKPLLEDDSHPFIEWTPPSHGQVHGAPPPLMLPPQTPQTPPTSCTASFPLTAASLDLAVAMRSKVAAASTASTEYAARAAALLQRPRISFQVTAPSARSSPSPAAALAARPRPGALLDDAAAEARAPVHSAAAQMMAALFYEGRPFTPTDEVPSPAAGLRAF